MDQILIRGGNRLRGSIRISGSKNSALPIFVASLLTNDDCLLHNVPKLVDIITMKNLLISLGVKIRSEGRTCVLRLNKLDSFEANYESVRKMRASILVLGPLLSKFGKAEVSLPGGCAIGSRPIDLHIYALKKMGANIKIKDGYIKGTVSRSSLKGAKIKFPKVSVGATENTLLAASLADGETIIENAAMEPEIDDLINVLNKMGAVISRVKNNVIKIVGVEKLTGFEHKIMSDRIEAGTYAIATAITGGKVELLDAPVNNLDAVLEFLRKMGVKVKIFSQGIIVDSPKELNNVDLVTEVYPGFPTDLQAQAMALMTVTNGISKIEEKIFENRFMHVSELMRFGAKIDVKGSKAIIKGSNNLTGAQVMATDLRASSSLVLAALRAKGDTVINRVYHLDRGYEDMEKKLSRCGAQVRRVHGK
ncbi:MAG: UDP-N-acetylglucosamine 1-carboxyvinyltransferase [Alphaproteobacteria bacterium MarineAlpha9_Bin1]|nr:MAG: UDP-N-acetylglucosamine 1-carboxyvinyltransferase [Alphaproteobacteria bacterium MarineAlpha9_Bin1]